jgi:hypothetical protein
LGLGPRGGIARLRSMRKTRRRQLKITRRGLIALLASP